MKQSWRSLLLVSLRWLLGLIFIYAAIGKILQPAIFAGEIDNYRMLPYVLVTIMAIVLPWMELLCGLALISRVWIKGACLLVIMMNIMFIIAIASAMARGLDISCGCFAWSDAASRVGWLRLIEDLVFLAIAFILYQKELTK